MRCSIIILFVFLTLQPSSAKATSCECSKLQANHNVSARSTSQSGSCKRYQSSSHSCTLAWKGVSDGVSDRRQRNTRNNINLIESGEFGSFNWDGADVRLSYDVLPEALYVERPPYVEEPADTQALVYLTEVDLDRLEVPPLIMSLAIVMGPDDDYPDQEFHSSAIVRAMLAEPGVISSMFTSDSATKESLKLQIDGSEISINGRQGCLEFNFVSHEQQEDVTIASYMFKTHHNKAENQCFPNM